MGDESTSSGTTGALPQRGGQERRRPKRGRRGGNFGHSQPGHERPDGPSQGADTSEIQTAFVPEGLDASNPQVSQSVRKPKYGRGRGRGNVHVSSREASNECEAPSLPIAENAYSSSAPLRGRGRGSSRGLPRSGGRGGNKTVPYPAHSSFNPRAPPFVPRFPMSSGEVAEGNSSLASPDFERRGAGFGVSEEGPNEFERLTSEVPRLQPQKRWQPQHQRQQAQSFGKPRGAGQPRNRRKPARRLCSDDDQKHSMRDRLINQLADNRYECAICCQVIHAKQSIWSCKTCYHMFHISGGCIINWAKKSKEEDNKWRCPTCQTKYEAIPYNYFCFCRKQRNPTAPLGETPHSCGGVCGGQRAPQCPHPCNEPCHPGPCPECPVMLTRRCNCGSVQKAIRCGSILEVKCDKVCDRLLTCGEHRCTRVCHEGICDPCEVLITQTCFCGSSSREILCSKRGESGRFSCGSPCSGMYNCGIHKCTRSCHLMGDSGCGPCPSAPERITHCPCGRCSLHELHIERKSCEDAIPTCKNVCAKVLKCGSAEKKHRCRALCHAGECPPCGLNTCVICRCKQVKRTLPCAEYLMFTDGNEFLCEKRCKKKKSCGIHKCQELCCVQTEHLCLQICNKRLSCGQHFCESICHAGQCPRCLNSSFEEQYCHCGRTMRPPPVPCGAPLPECDEPCARPHACNHPVTHNCHGEERCPPCTALVERMCYGKHEIRKNIPCHIEAVSCGRLCNKPLGCGVHNCNRNCHAGECMKEGEKCVRPCMALRRPCEHPCSLPCHGMEPCPESECRYPVNVTCECGKRKSCLKCSEFEKSIVRLRAVVVEDSEDDPNNGLHGVEKLKRSASMEQLNCMPCDDECKKAARNKKLAEALQLVTDENGMLEREPTITFTEYMKAELRSNAAFVAEVEKTFLELLDKLNDPTFLGPSLNHNFRPMSMEKRRFVHEYATFFSIETAGVDDPPRRSVIATARRGVSRAPLILLTFLLKYPKMLKSCGSVTLKSDFGEEKKKSEQTAEETTNCTSSMKTLRGSRQFKRRVAPEIARPSPLPQFNHFAVLRSDDEEESEASRSIKLSATKIAELQVKDPNWWSDEEEEVQPEDEASELISLLEDVVLRVCGMVDVDEGGEEYKDKDCKGSWSDEE